MRKTGWYEVSAGAAAVLGLSLLARRLGPETRPHALNGRKFVDARPSGLARAAGADLDTYALASCMESEEPTRAGKVAVGWAVLSHNLWVVARLAVAEEKRQAEGKQKPPPRKRRAG